MKYYRFIDLFAGLGGFHLALKSLYRYGIKCNCVFASELKADLRELYHINYPEVPVEMLNDDITKIAAQDIPAHDILCAGFPCQPFSQAGKRQGFDDEKNRGNLFDYICNIIRVHRPKFVILENVANLRGHDNGHTWEVIYKRLSSSIEEGGLNYEVKEKILSPHQFGIPQHRKRIYIVCVAREQGNLDSFEFPESRRKKCDINTIIDSSDTNVIKLKPEIRHKLSVWQEFIDQTIAHNDVIPTFPIWAMEFGATYDYENLAPAYQANEQLVGRRGKLGKVILSGSKDYILSQLPVYAQTDKTQEFPDWKKRYIRQNREFYIKHKEWLDEWLVKIEDFDNSHQKLEWNCGSEVDATLYDKIIQFRASGIRAKLPTFSPALNLVGTQMPILPWVELPKEILEDGEATTGRYMTIKEAAALQGMTSINFNVGADDFPLSSSRASEALGIAINVNLVRLIAKNLL